MEKEFSSTLISEDKIEATKQQSQWSEIPTSKEGPTSRVGHCCLFVPALNAGDQTALQSLGGGLYIVGGADPSQSYNDVHVLELDPFSWSMLMIGPFRARYEHSAFISEVHPNKIFIFGGADENGNKNDIQCLEMGEFKWSDITPSGELPTPRTYHNGVCVRDKFFVFGGGGLGSHAIDDDEMHVYDITNNHWQTLPTNGVRPSKRLGHIMVTMDNKIYLHGGMNEMDIFDDLHVLDLDTCSWTCMEVKGDKPSPRTSHGGIAHSNHIFILGGLLGESTSDEVFQLDIEARTWTKRDDLTMPRAALDFALCCFTGYLGNNNADIQSTSFETSDDKDSASPETRDPELKTFAIIHGGMNHTGDIFNDCYVIPLVPKPCDE